jgi:hypothetical protein
MLVVTSTGSARWQEFFSGLYPGMGDKHAVEGSVVNIAEDTPRGSVALPDNLKLMLMCVDCTRWYVELCANVDLSGIRRVVLFVDPQNAFPVSELQTAFGDNLDQVLSCRHDRIAVEVVPVLIKIFQN